MLSACSFDNLRIRQMSCHLSAKCNCHPCTNLQIRTLKNSTSTTRWHPFNFKILIHLMIAHHFLIKFSYICLHLVWFSWVFSLISKYLTSLLYRFEENVCLTEMLFNCNWPHLTNSWNSLGIIRDSLCYRQSCWETYYIITESKYFWLFRVGNIFQNRCA